MQSLIVSAKIGVLGVNGSGKSSLIRIIAGVDDFHDGKVANPLDSKIGYLEQEPELDEDLTVLENVLEGVSEQWEILQQYRELQEKEESGLSADEEKQLAKVYS